VKQTIKVTLTSCIQKLLTPKRHIDVLKEALDAKSKGKVFSIAFIGVNGVGKTTSLAKMAYYLKTKGNLKVMLAACDNFRSGAVE
jgi:signal recognition particle receptor subunit alpha